MMFTGASMQRMTQVRCGTCLLMNAAVLIHPVLSPSAFTVALVVTHAGTQHVLQDITDGHAFNRLADRASGIVAHMLTK